VLNRLADQAALLVPLGGATMQDLLQFGVNLSQAGPEDVRKQVVVTVPNALRVQRHQEEVLPVQPRQHLCAAGAVCNGIAERSRKAVQHSGLQQEILHVGGLAADHFLRQEVQHEAVAAREGGHEMTRISIPLQRQCSQLQAGSPAFRPGADLQNVGLRKRQLHGRAQKIRRLCRREAQVRGPDLHEPAPRPKTGKAQGRVSPCQNHEMQTPGEMLQDKADALVDGLCRNGVIIVQNQNDLVLDLCQFVQEQGQHSRKRRWLRRCERRQCGIADAGMYGLQGRDDVGPEPGWVVIIGVQRKPRDGLPPPGEPFTHQRGLAEPSRCCHQGQGTRSAAHELIIQPWPGDAAGAGQGCAHLGA
jgi:hypothetical protein